MKEKSIRVRDFSEFPGLRNCNISDKSGEEYYHSVLNGEFYGAVKANKTLVVDLDGVDAYAPSFLDEAFGNLVFDFSLKLVKERLRIISNDETQWLSEIEDGTFKKWEERRKKDEKPKITGQHAPWWRFVDNIFAQEHGSSDCHATQYS